LAEEGEEMIVFEDVDIGYPGKPLLQNLSLKISPGIHVLLGSNGSGKTTLLKTIAGLLKPLKGRITVNGVEPYRVKRREAAQIIGYTWQNPYHGFIEARVRDEIRFILEATGIEGDWGIVERLVPPRLMDRDPYTLSGGEAKRVSLASVLVANQDVWLLDEPFNELDYDGVVSLLGILGERRGKTIIVATHLLTLMDRVEPDTYILIDPSSRTVKTGSWSSLSDDELEEAGVLSRRMICGGTG
jgi:energy-coupling factor transport system ATP-binding protein